MDDIHARTMHVFTTIGLKSMYIILNEYEMVKNYKCISSGSTVNGQGMLSHKP